MDVLYYGNSLRSWLIAVTAALLLFGVLLIARRIVVGKLREIAGRTTTLIDDLIYELASVTKTYFLFFASFFLVTQLLSFSPETRLVLNRAFVLICLLQASSWGSCATAFWIEKHLKKRSLADATTATSIGLISFSVRFGLFAVLTLLAIHNLGFNITTLIAGLGVGGIAVALAVQNILGDLFASLTIVLDKPFVVGDFIVVGEFMGTLEHIGLKTTRIRSLSGEQLIFSNGDLLKSRVRNFKRMSERRVAFNLGVVYQTRPEELARIPAIIGEIISKAPGVRFERCHLLKLSSFSLDFEIVYWVTSPDFAVYADVAQQINLEILRRFGAERIEFAYPSQTLFVRPSANTAYSASASPLEKFVDLGRADEIVV